jgi:Uma2 family endonuclease
MDHFVYLHVDWRGYQQLLAMRGESSVPRITYLEGLAELMSPSRYHETDKTCFARLLETWSEIANVPLEGCGWWTLEDEEADRGAEADECYTVRREADDDVYRELRRSEFLPQLPIDVLLGCMKEPDQTSAVRALRAALATG